MMFPFAPVILVIEANLETSPAFSYISLRAKHSLVGSKHLLRLKLQPICFEQFNAPALS